MKDLSLGDLLRYGLGGGNFVAVYYLSYRESLPALHSIGASALIVGAALLVGAIIYSLHRALPYQFVILPITLFIAGHRSGAKSWENEYYEAMQQKDRVRQNAPQWGAQVHFLYSLWWSTLMVPPIGRLAGQGTTAIPRQWIYAAAVVYIIAGATSNVRLIKFIKSA